MMDVHRETSFLPRLSYLDTEKLSEELRICISSQRSMVKSQRQEELLINGVIVRDIKVTLRSWRL